MFYFFTYRVEDISFDIDFMIYHNFIIIFIYTFSGTLFVLNYLSEENTYEKIIGSLFGIG